MEVDLTLSFIFAVSKHKTLQAFQQGRPSLGPATFVAPSASLIGKVKLGRGSSVWYNAVLRGMSTVGIEPLRFAFLLDFALQSRDRQPGDLSLSAGDVNEISIGDYSNVQDGAIVHVAKNNAAGASLPTKIGNYVTIGTVPMPYFSPNIQCKTPKNGSAFLQSFMQGSYRITAAKLMSLVLTHKIVHE